MIEKRAATWYGHLFMVLLDHDHRLDTNKIGCFNVLEFSAMLPAPTIKNP